MKKKPMEIIVIASFISILFIPIGLVLMFYYTDWTKKKKWIIAGSLTALYVGLLCLFLFLKPAENTQGVIVPGNYTEGSTEFQSDINIPSKPSDEILEKDSDAKSKKETDSPQTDGTQRLPRGLTKTKGKDFNRWLWPLIFFLCMLYLIIHQNLKNARQKAYDNPYVDTDKYVLPFTPQTKFPIVHFLRLQTNKDEKILFATQTTQQDKEGDFVVTTQRVIILEPGNLIEFPLQTLTAIASTTDTVIKLTSGDHNYYIFMHESQVKYALATVRWAYANAVKE